MTKNQVLKILLLKKNELVTKKNPIQKTLAFQQNERVTKKRTLDINEAGQKSRI